MVCLYVSEFVTVRMGIFLKKDHLWEYSFPSSVWVSGTELQLSSMMV